MKGLTEGEWLRMWHCDKRRWLVLYLVFTECKMHCKMWGMCRIRGCGLTAAIIQGLLPCGGRGGKIGASGVMGLWLAAAQGEVSVKERFTLPEDRVVPFIMGQYRVSDALADLAVKVRARSPEQYKSEWASAAGPVAVNETPSKVNDLLDCIPSHP